MSQQPCLPLPKRKDRRRLAALSSTFPESRISGNMLISSLENMDAMSFLSAAHAEAQSLPDISVSTATNTSSNNNAKEKKNKTKKNNNDDDKNHDYVEGTHVSLSLLLSSKTDIPPCPSITLLPRGGDDHITAWIDGTLDNFSRLRLYLQSCQNMKLSSSNKNDRVPVPPMREAASWHEFCLGKSEAEGNTGGYFDDDESFHSETGGVDEDDDGDDDDNVVALWRSHVPTEGHPPKTKLLLQMDQVMTRRVLMHHVDFVCDGWELTEKRLSWIYALLARVEKPLHRDETALLRRLLRECCLRRIDMEGKGRALACVNVVITVVGIYFEQGMNVMEVNS